MTVDAPYEELQSGVYHIPVRSGTNVVVRVSNAWAHRFDVNKQRMRVESEDGRLSLSRPQVLALARWLAKVYGEEGSGEL